MERRTGYSEWVLEDDYERCEEPVCSSRYPPSRQAPSPQAPSRQAPRLTSSLCSISTPLRQAPSLCPSNIQDTSSSHLSNQATCDGWRSGLETDLEWGGIDRAYCNTWEQYSMNPTFDSNWSEPPEVPVPQVAPVPQARAPLLSSSTSSLSTSTSTSTSSFEEYPIVEPDNKYSHHRNTIETTLYSRDKPHIYYLRIQDIIRYITRGGSVCDEYLSVLIKHVIDNVPITDTVTEKRNTVNGTSYERTMPLIRNHQFTVVAKYCLDWIVSNPEKISIPDM